MKNFKKVVKELCDLGETTEKALQDGKIDILEWMSIGKEAVDVILVYKKIPLALQEYKNATKEQKQEAGQYLKDELDLINDNTEMIVENAAIMMLQVFTMFSKSKLEKNG